MASEKPRDPKRKKQQGPSKPPINNKKMKRKLTSSKNPNYIPLGKNKVLAEKKEKEKEKEEKKEEKKKKGKKNSGEPDGDTLLLSTLPAAHQLHFFLERFQSSNGFKLSPLELEAFKDTCIVELSQGIDQDADNLSKHMKPTFDTSWKEVLCEGKLLEGKIDAGSPAILIISTSAFRSLELLRGLKSFTRECRPAKLFAKHMKVEDQVALLKGRVNIASGTPSRIKKLIDMDALFLSRLSVVVFDMHKDAKGYSLFTLPQVSAEFWDLYRSHFNERLLQGDTRICFYGPTSGVEIKEAVQGDD